MFKTLLAKLRKRPLTRDDFAQTFIEAARNAGYIGALEYQPGDFRLLQSTGSHFNLHNVFHDYQQARPKQRQAVLEPYVRGLLSMQKNDGPKSFEQVHALLRPVIRNRSALSEIYLYRVRQDGWCPEAKSPPPALAWQACGMDCVTMLAVDYPDTLSTLTSGPPDDWGVTLEEALAIALSNLREITPDKFEEIAPGVYLGAWQDVYDSSRALLPDVLQRLAVKGRPVFMLPNRDVLLVTGDKDPAGLRAMLDCSFKAIQDGRLLSSRMHTYDERRIVPFTPQEPELQERLDELERRVLYSLYDAQKEALEAINEAHKEDVFVATYMLYQRGEDSETTFAIATWTEGITSSLPKADRIVLVQPRENDATVTLMVAWQEVETHLRDLLIVEPELYPPRYRTQDFPSAAQILRLAPFS